MSNLEAKKRHWKKVYDAALMIKCACGCGILIKSKDKYARNKKYVNGHNNRKYDDPKEYKRVWDRKNKSRKTKYRREARRKRKVILILYKSGKCYNCDLEYNGKNASIFDFHHRDPDIKSFGISGNVMEKSLEILKEEADKCDLMCSNCHRIIHSEEY